MQSTPSQPISLRAIRILSSHLRLPNSLFPSGFPDQNFVRIYNLSHTCCTLAHLILLGVMTLIMFNETYKLWGCSFLSFRWCLQEMKQTSRNHLQPFTTFTRDVIYYLWLQVEVSLVVTICSVVVGYQRFTLKIDGGSVDLWNVGILPKHYAVSQSVKTSTWNITAVKTLKETLKASIIL